jgi:hypothetical protein
MQHAAAQRVAHIHELRPKSNLTLCARHMARASTWGRMQRATRSSPGPRCTPCTRCPTAASGRSTPTLSTTLTWCALQQPTPCTRVSPYNTEQQLHLSRHGLTQKSFRYSKLLLGLHFSSIHPLHFVANSMVQMASTCCNIGGAGQKGGQGRIRHTGGRR